MEKSGKSTNRKVRERVVNAIAGTWDANTSLAAALRGFGAKILARKAQTSPRTAENWLAGENGPTWKNTVAMLQDDELCARLLKAAGRGDLARSAETIAALKAALVSEGK